MNVSEPPQDRRRFQRILFETPVNLLVKKHVEPATLIDISFKGALLKLPQEARLQSGQSVELVVPLDEEGLEIRMQGHIVHQEAEHIGLQCDHIDMDSITHLRRLVELNLGQPELLERELKALG